MKPKKLDFYTIKSTKNSFLFFFLFFLASVALVCIAARLLGSDINWDLQNYHFYNGYLVTHGLLLKDSLCTIQSYLELDINAFYYLLISSLSPLHVNLIIAFLQSFSISATWVFCYCLLEGEEFTHRIILSSVGAILAVVGPVFLSEIGGTMGDTLLELPIIIALILAIEGHAKNNLKKILLSGVFLGIASAAKLTNTTFAFGVGGAVFITSLIDLRAKKLFLENILLVVGFLAGFLVLYYRTGSMLFHAYGNPFFPYFSNIFHTPYMRPIAIADRRWFPENFWGYLLLPFEFVIRRGHQADPNHLIGLELRFRTLYLAIFAIIMPLCLILRTAGVRVIKNKKLFFTLVFVALSIVVWEVIFSYYRYIVLIETIAPSILLVLLFQLTKQTKLKHYSLRISCCSVVLISIYGLPPPNWGRIPYSSSYFGISKNDFLSYKNALIISTNMPMGFIYPYFPQSDRIMGLPERIPGLTQKFQNSYLAPLHEFKQIYIAGLLNADFHANEAFLEKNYGISVDREKCQNYVTYVDTVVLCPAKIIQSNH